LEGLIHSETEEKLCLGLHWVIKMIKNNGGRFFIENDADDPSVTSAIITLPF
jgi:hypothetical protein